MLQPHYQMHVDMYVHVHVRTSQASIMARLGLHLPSLSRDRDPLHS